MIDFSIIIPTKNEQKHIAGCLESINSVNYPADRYEILVIDNGSSDKTVEIAREKKAIVYMMPHLNISGLRNFGAKHSHGKILAFLDADCTVNVDWLNNASAYINRSDIVAFGSAPVVPNGATWVQNVWFNIRKKKKQVEDVRWLESMNLFIPIEVFRNVEGFNEDLITCEDYEIFTRIKRKGRIISDQNILAIHHGEAASIANFFRKERWRATSNYRGLRLRAIDFSEYPSIIIPLAHLVLIISFLLMGIMSVVGLAKPISTMILMLFWQFPIALLAIKKCGFKNPLTLIQLIFLCNVYFLARGFAIFRGGIR